MLLASCVGMIVAIWLTSVADNRSVLTSLRSAEMTRQMHETVLLYQNRMAHAVHTSDLCELVLQNMAVAALDSVVPNTQGPNRVSNAIAAGRVSAQFQDADGTMCAVGSSGRAATGAATGAATAMAGSAAVDNVSVQNEQGTLWSSRLSLPAPAGGQQTFALRMQVLSPWLSLVRNRDVSWGVIVFYIVTINFVSVFVLVPLLVKRIKRAELAADAWTQGDLSARIDDPRTDEFGRLCGSFDHMADVLANTIQVKLALAAADERNRLAQDLHDTAKQRAFALGLQLTALKKMTPGSAQWANITDAALTLVNHLQQDLVEVNRRLSAPTIAERGLRAALGEVVDALFAGSGTAWQLILPDAAEQALRTAPEIARQIFLISIEASANVLKHACARRLTMLMRQQGDGYVWTISDDGQGFNAGTAGGMGMGLANMRWRANTLPDGHFDMVSDGAGAAASAAAGGVPNIDSRVENNIGSRGTTINVSFRIPGSAIL